MEEKDIDRLIENEREWRRHIVKALDDSAKADQLIWTEIHSIKAWNLAFRVLGSTAFAIVLAYIQRG